MRHTLLPLNERKTLRREYRVRLLIIACFLFSLAGAVGIGSLFPAYMKALAEEKAGLDAAASLKKSQDIQGQTAIENRLRSDQKLLTTLSKNSNIRTSAVLQSLIALRGSVRISSFGISQPAEGNITVSMQGVAPTRDALLSFKGRLESTLPGAKVTLPIDQLAKSNNITYSMSVSYKVQ